MRNNIDIDKIKSTISNPWATDKFLTDSEIDILANIFDSTEEHNNPYSGKINKNTGPVTLDLENHLTHPIVSKILNHIEKQIGKFEITAAFFFKTDYPHIIHNDDTFELPDTVYKGITVPLKLYGENIIDYPSLCFFDQFYFHGPAKFFKGEEFVPTYYNKQIYEYSQVDNLNSTSVIDLDIYKKYFTHIKKSWLEGLTLKTSLPWIPGSAIIFDSVRLHCASDFRKLGIREKLGISIFTKT